jgi:tetratricopeptide (TPR) repeat protein
MPAQESAPRLINATILFIDLMNSVALSNSLSLWEYNELINEFQHTLHEVLDELPKRFPVGEFYLGGDQLAVFFYNPDDVLEYRAGTPSPEPRTSRRRISPPPPSAEELGAQQRQIAENRNRALFGALRLAVSFKNHWISHQRNMDRLASDQPVLDVGVGINTGNVVLEERGDGRARIEGYAINFAKRMQGFARHGRFCKIMFSKQAYENFRSIVVEHAMLKQRAFFQAWTPQEGLLKGLTPGTQVYELKFFHRLGGFVIPAEHVGIFERIFERDPANIWAYTNLMNYFLYDGHDMERASGIVEQALYCNPDNEKVYYDLALLHFERQEFELARTYGQHCLKLNDQMDIAYDLLADIVVETGGPPEQQLEYVSRALALTPGSAAYQLSMAEALHRAGQAEAARRHYETALSIFPRVAELSDSAARIFGKGEAENGSAGGGGRPA